MGGNLFVTGKGFEFERNWKSIKIKIKERSKQTHFLFTNQTLFTTQIRYDIGVSYNDCNLLFLCHMIIILFGYVIVTKKIRGQVNPK
jgi:hypothetical protein